MEWQKGFQWTTWTYASLRPSLRSGRDKWCCAAMMLGSNDVAKQWGNEWWVTFAALRRTQYDIAMSDCHVILQLKDSSQWKGGLFSARRRGNRRSSFLPMIPCTAPPDFQGSRLYGKGGNRREFSRRAGFPRRCSLWVRWPVPVWCQRQLPHQNRRTFGVISSRWPGLRPCRASSPGTARRPAP